MPLEYIYENESGQSQEESQTREGILSVGDLIKYLFQMPPGCLKKLYRATIMGTDDTIWEFLERVAPELKPLAKTLSDLTHNYQFEVIIEAIETLQKFVRANE